MKKVIIIGAGPAGLTAADKLLDYNEEYEVTILEESQDIGGISKTVEYNGNRMDIGGHMFFKNYTERLWGRKTKNISSDWGAQRVKGVSITAIIKDMINKVFKIKNKKNTETSLIEEFWYPKYGPGQLWNTLAKRIET